MKKYILFLLWSVFVFGQAGNQMVSYTQASSLGFPLNSGQSHVTSPQCMTKSDALAKYNLSTTLMSGFSNNQLVPRENWASGVTSYSYQLSSNVYPSPAQACFSNNPRTVYSSSSSITDGMVVWADATLTTPIVQRNDWYKIGSNQSCKILSGVVNGLTTCAESKTLQLVLVGPAPQPSACDVDFSAALTKYTMDGLVIDGHIYNDAACTSEYGGESIEQATFKVKENGVFKKVVFKTHNNIIGTIENCPPPPDPTPLYLIECYKGSTEAGICFSSVRENVYSDHPNMGLATKFYKYSDASAPSDAGWYKMQSSGYYVYWNGTSLSAYSNCDF